METTKLFEVKVGVFILIGIMILFIIVFSIGDINISKNGYKIKILFGFASGIGPSAPVRLAGVGVGQIQGIRILHDPATDSTMAEITAWISDNTKVEKDAVVTINTLGLLGEKYLEILPGTAGSPALKNGDTIMGKDPVPMEKVTENLANLSSSINVIVERLKNGEGTIGKLMAKDEVYDDIKAITGNFKEFSEDIKRHPWKLLSRGKD